MYSVIGADGQVYGPVDMATLQAWIAQGRIVPTTNLIDPLDGRVVQAQNAPALHGAFPMGMPPPVQPTPGPYTKSSPFPGANAPVGYPRAEMMAYGPPKSKAVAIVLAFFLGTLGIHRFYLGHNGTGIAMLLLTVLTCGAGMIVTSIWAIVDIVLIATDSLRDANGQALA